MSRLKLKYWERRRLRRQLKAESDARTYRRILAVLELDRGRSAIDIAAMLGVTRQSVHNWAAVFAREPYPSALADADRSGRPPLLSQQAEAQLSDLMGQSPQDLGYPHTDWTIPAAPAGVGEALGPAAFGRDGETWTPAARFRLEAAALRPRTRPRAREKNGGFGGKSGPFLTGALYWPRTRPT